jgi:formylglycine-generating enzyme required for sulfatase activity
MPVDAAHWPGYYSFYAARFFLKRKRDPMRKKILLSAAFLAVIIAAVLLCKTNKNSVLIWVYSKPAKVEFSKSEVTVAQFEKCAAAKACKQDGYVTKENMPECNWGYSDRDNYPMNCVNWFGAADFCKWALGRLPTEEEWYAEASNNEKRQYPWGDGEANCDRAVMKEDGEGCGLKRSAAACSKEQGNSVSGLCDMSGNVWEWTSSPEGDDRIVRGGGWGSSSRDQLKSTGREGRAPWGKNSATGFRCARAHR